MVESTDVLVNLHCRSCHAVCPCYAMCERRRRHLDTCQYQRLLVVVDVPRIMCAELGIKQTNVPWAEERSRFTGLFKMRFIEWLKEASANAVSWQRNLGWDAIDGIMQRAGA